MWEEELATVLEELAAPNGARRSARSRSSLARRSAVLHEELAAEDIAKAEAELDGFGGGGIGGDSSSGKVYVALSSCLLK